MIERWPEAVIFDMDGLMLDTEAPALRAWERAARGLGREFDLDLCRQMIGRNFGDCVALIRARHGPDYPVDAADAGLGRRLRRDRRRRRHRAQARA